MLIAATVGLTLIVAAAALDGILLSRRIHHIAVRFPASDGGTTWVIAGSDSRAALPADANPAVYGSAGEVPGARADVVLVVHEQGGRTSVLSIPRDMLVSPTPGEYERLTLTLLGGPQQLIDGLCSSLGIPATRLVIVDFAAFASIVDAVGGVTVTLPAPIRDPYASLSIPRGGSVHLNGVEALALVRSRVPEWLVDGRWVPVPDGSLQRTEWAGRVMNAVVGTLRDRQDNPLVVQQVAWAASGRLTTDTATGLPALAGLRNVHAAAAPLPAARIANTLAVRPDAATRTALAAAGFPRICTPAG